jgi:hypothetical protein
MLGLASMTSECNSQPERPPTYEDGQDIRDRAFEYACCVVAFCEGLMASAGVGRLMVPQLLDCSLSRKAAKPSKRGHEFQIPNS